jgi:hypothetical protein
MKKWKKILLIVVVISLFLGCVSVDAQVNSGYNGNDWTAQHKLDIIMHQQNGKFSANGVDEAKMNIVIRNKMTNSLAGAQSNIEVLFRSSKGIVEPQNITILKDKAMSGDISLTSTQPGIANVIAEAVGFEEATYASVEFVPPPVPCELLLTSFPNENVLADGRHPTTLTVKLLNPDDEPFIPQVDRDIHIWTNRGEKPPQIIIYGRKPYGQGDFMTYKKGTVSITAKSHDFNLENSTAVTFISPTTLLTLVVAALGGFCAGASKYYRDFKDKIFIPKKIDGTLRLGFFGHLIFHSLFGTVIYILASLNIPGTNVFNLPISITRGAFGIGFLGGFFFFVIISFLGICIKRAS